MNPEPPRRQPDRAERRAAIRTRDGDRCVWCGRAFGRLVPATTDHLVPRVKGGPSWVENELAACRRCNGQRGHSSPIDWLQRCEERGWSPDPVSVQTAMEALNAAIVRRGGQRRAARYLQGQRRRWANR